MKPSSTSMILRQDGEREQAVSVYVPAKQCPPGALPQRVLLRSGTALMKLYQTTIADSGTIIERPSEYSARNN